MPGEHMNSDTRNLTVVVDNVHVVHRSVTESIEEVPPRRRPWARLGKVIGLPYHTRVHALRDVSLRAYEGDNIGIIGVNGSGKSTLLRVIAGLHPPASGSVLTSSTPSLIGVNAALVPKLTGRKNVELGLLALGYTPKEAKELYPEVAELASIGSAMHRPMSTYSSGMGARLRFAISMAAKPDILIIDEALGTGDARFTARADQAMQNFRNNAGTIFLVSHAAQTIQQLCTRAIWLHEGQVVADGPAQRVSKHYRIWTTAISRGEHERAAQLFADASKLPSS